MPSRFTTWLFATIFALLTGTHALAGDGLRMVTATGRAVINDHAAQHEAKNIALEDALYLAALRGGAKINGFSSVQGRYQS
jgi:hypothetical protein